MTEITKVAVLGSGTMGIGIAAINANAGCDVLLLDMDQAVCDNAKEKLLLGRSPIISDESVLERIQTGSFENDLNRISDCDWICEAIIENVDIKRQMFLKVEALRKDGSIITTNTSGIPLRDIYAEMPLRLQQDIAVTHFFNPVHIMKLVELVAGEQTRPEVIQTLANHLDRTLDKGVVYAKDTVNFIGNRIGCMWVLAGLQMAEKAIINDGLTIETVDALLSDPLGIPPTGLYGLTDLIGIDVMYNVGKNLELNLPEKDFCRQFTDLTKNVQAMYDRGQLGRKSGGGFNKLIRHDDGSKTMQVFDITKHSWADIRPYERSEDEQDFSALFEGKTKHSELVRNLMTATLAYSADLVPEIANDIVNVDRAMRWGFAWQKGPFELIDELGADTLIRHLDSIDHPIPAMLKVLKESGETTFYRANGTEFLTTQGNWQSVPA